MATVVDFAKRTQRPYPGTGSIWAFAYHGGSGNYQSLAYGDGVIVGISNSVIAQQILRSVDFGITWTPIAAPAGLNYTSACYCGGGIFLSIASNGGGNQIMRSVDYGLTWGSVAEPVALQWTSICYHRGIVIAVAQNGAGNQIARSTNRGAAGSWASIAEPSTRQWQDVCALDGHFIAVAQDGVGNQVMESSDLGLTWQSRAESLTTTWKTCCGGNGRIVALAPAGAFRGMYSDDYGVTWNTGNPGNRAYNAIAFGNNRFVGCTTGATVGPFSDSIDGVMWGTSWSAMSARNMGCVEYCYDRFVSLGNEVVAAIS